VTATLSAGYVTECDRCHAVRYCYQVDWGDGSGLWQYCKHCLPWQQFIREAAATQELIPIDELEEHANRNR